MGPVENAVTQELAGLAENRPGLIEIARRLAADLDNAAFVSAHAGLSRELQRVLNTAHTLPRSGGRLAEVVKLASRR